MKKSVSSIFSIFILGTSALAQEGPSYAETANFIQSKLADRLSGSSDTSSTSQDFSLIEREHCVFVYKNAYRGKHKDGNHYEDRATQLYFEKIDPSEITIGSYNSYFGVKPVRLRTRENRSVLPFTSKPVSGCTMGCTSKSYEESTLEMYSFEPERLQRALVHMTKLCGGKEELF